MLNTMNLKQNLMRLFAKIKLTNQAKLSRETTLLNEYYFSLVEY